ncbi:universal stress protein [Halosolutus gelatinilyticus]|uniref:universal stress protein n=1 Tax=Halosolutus gelatinilyticus TaxID=2931975 RepID=UPI001FF2C27F|nr:universal stress protein [Halosolutus gelatinilyticus]
MPEPERILVPVDDSEPAREALRYAAALFPDAEFVALAVVDASSVPFIPNAADDPDASPELQESLGEADDHLDVADRIASEDGIALETQTRVGSPAQEIVDCAEDGEFDHVVIGSHGRSGVSRIVLGSVAEVVVRHSPVPVTVVR